MVRLHAAGSLRAALTEIAAAFLARRGVAAEAVFGASGLLRGRIEGGEPAEVFASANLEHPLALAGAGLSGPVALFARNRLCALVRPGLDAEPATLLDRMLDPALRLGTSTPGADPSGDYAWEVFRRAETLCPGAFAALAAKALQLTGGPRSPLRPRGPGVYAGIIAQGEADLFLTYVTTAAAAVAEVPGARIVALPEPLAVGAEYGLTVLDGASAAARDFALFVLSIDGQAALARHGFDAPSLRLDGQRSPGQAGRPAGDRRP